MKEEGGGERKGKVYLPYFALFAGLWAEDENKMTTGFRDQEEGETQDFI